MRRLAKAYYDRETGFTAAGLAKKAGVKEEEARAFLRDQEALQVKRRRTGNFVAPYRSISSKSTWRTSRTSRPRPASATPW